MRRVGGGVVALLGAGAIGSLAGGDGVWFVVALVVAFCSMGVLAVGTLIGALWEGVRCEYRHFQIAANRARRIAKCNKLAHTLATTDDVDDGELGSPIGLRDLLP